MTPPTDQDKESEIKVLDDKISKIKGENLKALCSKMQENQKIEDKKIKVKNLSKRKKIQPNSAQESPRSELKTLVEKMKLKREERFEKKETEKINKKNSEEISENSAEKAQKDAKKMPISRVFQVVKV